MSPKRWDYSRRTIKRNTASPCGVLLCVYFSYPVDRFILKDNTACHGKCNTQ